MRSEQEMFDLILETAKQDERIRAVILNGSRANPNAPRDPFQDFDVVYFVVEAASFRHDREWIRRFGEMMILQVPEDMHDPPLDDRESFAYLMQFADGNRIDLTICPLAERDSRLSDSLALLLLDKDGILKPFVPADERDYLPQAPTVKAFADCCNEFWWCSPYAAKGLWRRQIIYAKFYLDVVLRGQLMKMIDWYVGVKTGFQKNPGSYGKFLERYLPSDLWELLLKTYSDGAYEHSWDALLAAGNLFRKVALPVGEHFGFEYPKGDDERVTAHLRHVRTLPRDAREIY